MERGVIYLVEYKGTIYETNLRIKSPSGQYIKLETIGWVDPKSVFVLEKLRDIKNEG